jgi:hypothetical protein
MVAAPKVDAKSQKYQRFSRFLLWTTDAVSVGQSSLRRTGESEKDQIRKFEKRVLLFPDHGGTG